jgi:hypothetical protein
MRPIGVLRKTNENAFDDIRHIFDPYVAPVVLNFDEIIAVIVSLEISVKVLDDILSFHFRSLKIP